MAKRQFSVIFQGPLILSLYCFFVDSQLSVTPSTSLSTMRHSRVMRHSRALEEATNSEEERRLKYRGAACISLDALQFSEDDLKTLDAKNVERPVEVFRAKVVNGTQLGTTFWSSSRNLASTLRWRHLESQPPPYSHVGLATILTSDCPQTLGSCASMANTGFKLVGNFSHSETSGG